MKRAAEDQPWVENYPPLKAWLDKWDMRCQEQHPIGGTPASPTAYLEIWSAPRATGLVYVLVRAYRHGWDLLTGVSTNSVPETLADAEQRMGLVK